MQQVVDGMNPFSSKHIRQARPHPLNVLNRCAQIQHLRGMLAAGGASNFRRPRKASAVSKVGVNNFVHALVAVLAGNAVYSLLIPYLPGAVRHAPFKNGLGLAIDFWFCLVAFGIVKSMARWKGHSSSVDHR
jgi:hypothetical protein